jgi:selenoprotein W-related protein
MAVGPHIEIRYCTGCRWGLRAAWLAQELLSTFEDDLSAISLIPDATGGIFDIKLDGSTVWSRSDQKRFPEPKEIKQLVRDIVAPGRDLGHIDS